MRWTAGATRILGRGSGFSLTELLLVLFLLFLAFMVGSYFVGRQRIAGQEKEAQAYGRAVATALEQAYLEGKFSGTVQDREAFLAATFTSRGFYSDTNIPSTWSCNFLPDRYPFRGIPRPSYVECAVGVLQRGGTGTLLSRTDTFVVYTKRVGGNRVYSTIP